MSLLACGQAILTEVEGTDMQKDCPVKEAECCLGVPGNELAEWAPHPTVGRAVPKLNFSQDQGSPSFPDAQQLAF